MESTEAKIVNTITIYSIVQRLERRTIRTYVSGYGNTTKFVDEDLGWFIHFEGSHESIHIGFDDPPFKPMQRIKITFAGI